jgi:hypothetical protein
MGEFVLFYKILPYLVYLLCAVLSISSGVLVYRGMSSETERVQTRLRIRHSIQTNREKIAKSATESAEKSSAELWFKKAGYPLGLNSFSYHLILFSLVVLLVVNYVLIPLIFSGQLNMIAFAVIVLGAFFLLPWNPVSAFGVIMKRVVDYQNAKRNGEVFMLYDLLINELQMMTSTRINAYNLLRGMLPYFSVIKPHLAKTLSVWSSDEGPEQALDDFAEEMGTREAQSLVSVIKMLDRVERDTAIQSLKGMQNMFARSQIENYRRRRKVTTDLMGIPIKVTHFLIVLNFIVLIVVMVSSIISGSRAM